MTTLVAILAALAVWLVLTPAIAAKRVIPATRRRPRGEQSTDVAVVTSELSALLRAGALPARAWELATRGLAEDPSGAQLRSAAAAIAEARNPSEDLRHSHDAGVRALGAAWWVSEHTGAPLAQVLDSVASAIRDADDAARARKAAMAGPVTTARILAVLPVLGLLMGQAIGAKPLQTLVSTPYGRLCAVIGLICAVLGWWWTSRLIATARAES